MEQLISYIAPSAPATRRPATGNEPSVRPEIGFTPNWYRSKLEIDFSEQWHHDAKYRKETIIAMRNELDRRFPGRKIGVLEENSLDLLTGIYGTCTIAAIYGIPLIYSKNNWPNCAHKPISDIEMKTLIPPDLDSNLVFQNLMKQVDWVQKDQGKVIGFCQLARCAQQCAAVTGRTAFHRYVYRSRGCFAFNGLYIYHK